MRSFALILAGLLSPIVSAESKALTVEPGLCAIGQEYETHRKDDRGSLVSVTWTPLQPMSLQYGEFWQRVDGGEFRQVCVLSLCEPGEYIVLANVSDHEARTSRNDTWTITVEGDVPDPDPEPEPEPGPEPDDEIEAKVRQLARDAPMASRNKAADVFERVGTQLADGKLKSIEAAILEIKRGTSGITLPGPLVDYIATLININVDKSMPAIAVACHQVARGLRR